MTLKDKILATVSKLEAIGSITRSVIYDSVMKVVEEHKESVDPPIGYTMTLKEKLQTFIKKFSEREGHTYLMLSQLIRLIDEHTETFAEGMPECEQNFGSVFERGYNAGCKYGYERDRDVALAESKGKLCQSSNEYAEIYREGYTKGREYEQILRRNFPNSEAYQDGRKEGYNLGYEEGRKLHGIETVREKMAYDSGFVHGSNRTGYEKGLKDGHYNGLQTAADAVGALILKGKEQ